MHENSVARLRIITFLQYVVICGVIPVMSLYLKSIEGITGSMVGAILAMATAAAIISPLISVYVADRYIKTERLFSLCNLAASFLLFLLRLQKHFVPLAVVYLLVMLFLTPPSALINIMVFNSLGKEKGRFGSIRVWGTFGWIFMSLFFSYAWLGNLFFKSIDKSVGDILYFSSAVALFLGLYTIFPVRDIKRKEAQNAAAEPDAVKNAAALPDGKGIETVRGGLREEEQSSGIRGRTAPGGIKAFASSLNAGERRNFFIFIFISFFISVVDKYYYLGISPFLKKAGIADMWIMPVISSGNIIEIVLMFLLFRIITRYGFRATMAAGIVAQIFRFTVFSFSGSIATLMAGVLVHGATFALFSAAAFIYLDLFSTSNSRTANHLIYSFIISGGGNLAGNLIAGMMLDLSLSCAGSYLFFWAVPAIISLFTLALVVIFIKDTKPQFQEK